MVVRVVRVGVAVTTMAMVMTMVSTVVAMEGKDADHVDAKASYADHQ